MNATPEQFDKAFAEFQQFGPRRRIPIEERWCEILPEIASTEFLAIKAQCQGIEAFAYSLAEQVRDGKMATLSAEEQLAQKYPFLTPARIIQTWSHATYFCNR